MLLILAGDGSFSFIDFTVLKFGFASLFTMSVIPTLPYLDSDKANVLTPEKI